MKGGCYKFEKRIVITPNLYYTKMSQMLHMLPKTDEGNKRIEKYLLENANPEVKPIPKKDEKPKKETPKNDDYNHYDYSDDTNGDDSKW